MPTLSTCLWFATEAEEAARFYAATIPGGAHGQRGPHPARRPDRR